LLKIVLILSNNLILKTMEMELLTDAEKIRSKRENDIRDHFARIKKNNPLARKSVIVKMLSKRHMVSESTVRNILSKNFKEEDK
jgi:hypothetical protein